MAARAVAAAPRGLEKTVFSSCSSSLSRLSLCSSCPLDLYHKGQQYSREFLLEKISTFFSLEAKLAEEPSCLELLCYPSRVKPHPERRRRRRQKRGKRGGIRARLAASPHKPAIPTLLMANVRSLDNKMDNVIYYDQPSARDCCVYVFTETWLHKNIPDSAIQLDKLTCYQADRNKDSNTLDHSLISIPLLDSSFLSLASLPCVLAPPP